MPIHSIVVGKSLPGNAPSTKAHSNSLDAFEVVTGSIFNIAMCPLATASHTIQADLVDERHLISPRVATTEHPRPPSSLNNNTIKAHAATRADIKQTPATTFCGVGR